MSFLNAVVTIPILNIITIAVCIILAFFGYIKKIVDIKALIFVLFFAIFYILFFPLYWFASMMIIYILTSIATNYKRTQKMVAHIKGRQIKNLLSNLLPSLVFSIIYLVFPDPSIYCAFLCGISCACSDTLASEIGQMSKKNPRLITTFEEVKTGTDGGVSFLGLFIGLIGAILVSAPAFYFGYKGFEIFILASFVGFIGCNIDSFIGAKFELKGKCSNETTNLIATTTSSLLGLILFLFML